jgi:hypothetical protein
MVANLQDHSNDGDFHLPRGASALLLQLRLPFNRLHSRILKKSANLVLDSFETDAYFANRRGLRLRTMGRERRTMQEEDGMSDSLLSRLVSIIPVEW